MVNICFVKIIISCKYIECKFSSSTNTSIEAITVSARREKHHCKQPCCQQSENFGMETKCCGSLGVILCSALLPIAKTTKIHIYDAEQSHNRPMANATGERLVRGTQREEWSGKVTPIVGRPRRQSTPLLSSVCATTRGSKICLDH